MTSSTDHKGDNVHDSTSEVKPNIAIFGASGHLGMYITKAFLAKDARPRYNNITLFTRSLSRLPSEFELWRKEGAVKIAEVARNTLELNGQLTDIDIVVNTIGSEGDALRTEIVKAMEGLNVKLYIPSEFGVDHTVHDFSHREWDKKKAHFELAKNLLKDTKICRIYCGLFLEDSIGPWFGFDTKAGHYESYGSSKEKVTYTSLGDVGKIVADIVLMSPIQIPPQAHFCGDLVSMKDIAAIMTKQSGSEVEIVEQSLQESKKKELDAARPDPSGCLRFLMGERRIQHTPDALGCDNELVNPDQKKWRWRTMTDLAEETGGKPWADATWS